MADFKQAAARVLAAVGGKDNVSSVTHCMTRLRFLLKDASVPSKDAVSKIKGVVGVNIAGGQYQVIIGNPVANVYQEILALGVAVDGISTGGKKAGLQCIFNRHGIIIHVTLPRPHHAAGR